MRKDGTGKVSHGLFRKVDGDLADGATCPADRRGGRGLPGEKGVLHCVSSSLLPVIVYPLVCPELADEAAGSSQLAAETSAGVSCRTGAHCIVRGRASTERQIVIRLIDSRCPRGPAEVGRSRPGSLRDSASFGQTRG